MRSLRSQEAVALALLTWGAAGRPSLLRQQGQAVEKKQMVRSWQRLATRGGCEKGSEDISGHSARRSGAKMLCRCGWDLWKVQFHARWASDTVKLYTEEVWSEQAHLWRIRARDEHDTCPDPRKRWATRTGLDEVREEVERLRKQQSRRPRMHEEGLPLAARVNQEELARKIARIIDGEGKFLQNVAGVGKVHRLLCAEGSVESWKTQCGWAPAGRGRFRLRLCPPSQCELRCQRCFEGAEEAVSAQGAAIDGPTPAAA